MVPHEGYIEMIFCFETFGRGLKICKITSPTILGAHNFRAWPSIKELSRTNIYS
jgi:hypothetical protein